MGATEEARGFWTDVVRTGGATAIPRWTLEPVPGTGVHRTVVPKELQLGLGRLAEELVVPVGTLLLAAHAKVLAVLSGEPEVTAGCAVDAAGGPLPCRLSVEPGTWRELIRGVRRVEAGVLVHQDFPLDELQAQLALPGPSFETVVDPRDLPGELAGSTVLRVGLHRSGSGWSLTLRHRTEALDAEAAARIAGYHLTALRLMVEASDAQHADQSLLSAEELRFQLEELAGPHRELPELRAHELFELQAAAHPDRIAAVQGERRWSYREVNSRANRLARALLARGLAREDVVAVVAERGLEWLAAVLAVLKAGGVYLPVEPHFPAQRIESMLVRSDCRFALTEPGSSDALDQALKDLPQVCTLPLDTAWQEVRCADDPAVRVAPDQLAYIYFTSGSTGEPKGAMCEHAGLLNHLLAKIDDLGIGPEDVVAQTAPQCFDISLWQLLSALVVGGRTLLVGQEEVLDVRRFLDTIGEGRATVLQLVPSYLELVLSALEREPRPLLDLRRVSATGEALRAELARRWFTSGPGVPLVNAYGLTETSDDTNHEVMYAAPEGDRVPLGRPVNNVRALVVDEQLTPVPLGAPGLLVFAGVCVGRGYVNDPERTRLAFTADPYRPGERLYRTGDHGRWRPDGKLEFLGRRDGQVKVSGFRIEIGEVENALLRVPGIRDAAVVVAQRPGGGGYLTAHYSADEALPLTLLRARLSETLPAYMVPTVYEWRQRLPLTPNGKIDRKALLAAAGATAASGASAASASASSAADGSAGAGPREHRAPRTPAEQRLAAAWAKALGIPQEQIGRHDHFFDRGGTSLAAVRLAIDLDRAISLADLTRHPVLADLAALLTPASPVSPASSAISAESVIDNRT